MKQNNLYIDNNDTSRKYIGATKVQNIPHILEWIPWRNKLHLTDSEPINIFQVISAQDVEFQTTFENH